MPKRSFRLALAVVVASIAVALGVAWYFVDQALDYPDRRHAGRGAQVEVEIERGMSFPQIAQRLAERGVIDRPRWFKLYAMQEGKTTKVRPGRYVIGDNLTPREVLAVLTRGVEEKQVEVRLQPGKNMLEYFDALHAAGVIEDRAAIEALARDPEFLRGVGIEGETVDGYLAPDTYRFVAPTAPRKVLERLIGQHRAVWNKLLGEHGKGYQRVRDRLSWSDRDILVMASIVEKEAVRADEQPRIAQVFINRLTFSSFRPKRLETDPTIRYGCQVPVRKSAACSSWDPAGRLFRAQLDDKDNPYNTYQHEGLPPGPIGNPGPGAIRAVLEPDGSDYLFFVAMDDTTHVFARSLREHERNVDKYIRGKP